MKHTKVEKELYDKYLGNVTMQGLQDLVDGHPMSPTMQLQQEVHMQQHQMGIQPQFYAGAA